MDFRGLWAYRELLLFLTWRDIKVRYKQTVLGVAWAVIQPLFTMLIFTIFFGKLGGMRSDGVPYPLFAYAALLPWTFFSNAITLSGNSLIGNANLITKVYFPRMLIPAAAVMAGLADLAIAFVLMFLLLPYYGMGFRPHLLMLPVLVTLTTMLAIGAGMWLSALNVKYRDIRYAIPFAVQLLMFATPIIYPSTLVPPRWRWLLLLNPLSALIDGYRSAFFGRPFAWGTLALSAAMILALLVVAAYDFKRMENTLADLV